MFRFISYFMKQCTCTRPQPNSPTARFTLVLHSVMPRMPFSILLTVSATSATGCQPVSSDLTLLWRTLCGWDPIDQLARSPSVSFLCSRQSSGSLSLPVTLALSWTVRCQCRNMYLALPISFVPPTTTPTSDQIADTRSCPDSGPGIYIGSPWSL